MIGNGGNEGRKESMSRVDTDYEGVDEVFDASLQQAAAEDT